MCVPACVCVCVASLRFELWPSKQIRNYAVRCGSIFQYRESNYGDVHLLSFS